MIAPLCNLLGRLSTTYRFEDGSIIRRSSRESIAYERSGKLIHVELLYDGVDGYEYYLPPGLNVDERRDLTAKVEEYCKCKGYRLTNKNIDPATFP